MLRAPVGGGTTVTVASGLLGIPVAVLVDTASLYWTSRAAYADDLLPAAPMSIPLAGGTPAPVVSDVGDSGAPGYPSAFAMDEGSLYWATMTAILRLSPK